MIYIASKIISYRFVSDKSVAHQLIYQPTDGPNLIEMVDNFSCRLTVSMFMYLFITVSKKSQKLKIFAISQFWFVGVVGQKIAVATSNSIDILFGPLLAPCQISSKSDEKHRSWKFLLLVGFGRSGL